MADGLWSLELATQQARALYRPSDCDVLNVWALEEVPLLYWKESPISRVADVETPLLLLHGKRDENVPGRAGRGPRLPRGLHLRCQGAADKPDRIECDGVVGHQPFDSRAPDVPTPSCQGTDTALFQAERVLAHLRQS